MKGMIIILYFTLFLIPGSLISQTLQVNAGNDTTVYLGYSLGTATLRATVTGGHPPYLIVWSTEDSTAVITVHPLATTYYIVMVKDSLNSIAKDTVKVNVADVRCGQKNDKVLVCHKGEIICIDEHAVQAHLEHGDVLDSCTITSVEPVNVPAEFKLYNNYPNPFNPVTVIKYQLPKSDYVSLVVYDGLGQEVEVIYAGKQGPGYYEVTFDGSQLSSGVYFYKLTAGNFVGTKKMLMIK